MTNVESKSKIRILSEELTHKKNTDDGTVGRSKEEIEKRNKAKRVYFKKENLKIEDIKKTCVTAKYFKYRLSEINETAAYCEFLLSILVKQKEFDEKIKDIDNKPFNYIPREYLSIRLRKTRQTSKSYERTAFKQRKTQERIHCKVDFYIKLFKEFSLIISENKKVTENFITQFNYIYEQKGNENMFALYPMGLEIRKKLQQIFVEWDGKSQEEYGLSPAKAIKQDNRLDEFLSSKIIALFYYVVDELSTFCTSSMFLENSEGKTIFVIPDDSYKALNLAYSGMDKKEKGPIFSAYTDMCKNIKIESTKYLLEEFSLLRKEIENEFKNEIEEFNLYNYLQEFEKANPLKPCKHLMLFFSDSSRNEMFSRFIKPYLMKIKKDKAFLFHKLNVTDFARAYYKVEEKFPVKDNEYNGPPVSEIVDFFRVEGNDYGSGDGTPPSKHPSYDTFSKAFAKIRKERSGKK